MSQGLLVTSRVAHVTGIRAMAPFWYWDGSCHGVLLADRCRAGTQVQGRHVRIGSDRMSRCFGVCLFLGMVRLHSLPSRCGPAPSRSSQSLQPRLPPRSSQNHRSSAAGSQGSRPAARARESKASKSTPSRSRGVAKSSGASNSVSAGSSSHAPARRSGSCGVAPPPPPAPVGIVGQVTETDARHRKRHPRIRSDCPRCQYMQYGPQWEKHYGCHRSDTSGKRSGTVWLQTRPCRLGGLWGLGCTFCSHWAQQQADRKSAARVAGVELPKRRRGARDGQTKWARFEIRCLTQVAMRGVSQHAKTLMHRKAVRAYFTPEPSVNNNTRPAEISQEPYGFTFTYYCSSCLFPQVCGVVPQMCRVVMGVGVRGAPTPSLSLVAGVGTSDQPAGGR